MRSLPLSTIGIAYFCIGVGFVYPDFFTLPNKCGLNPELSNVEIGGGTFSPLTYKRSIKITNVTDI